MTKVVICRRLLDVRKNSCLFLSRPMTAFWKYSRKKAKQRKGLPLDRKSINKQYEIKDAAMMVLYFEANRVMYSTTL